MVRATTEETLCTLWAIFLFRDFPSRESLCFLYEVAKNAHACFLKTSAAVRGCSSITSAFAFGRAAPCTRAPNCFAAVSGRMPEGKTAARQECNRLPLAFFLAPALCSLVLPHNWQAWFNFFTNACGHHQRYILYAISSILWCGDVVGSPRHHILAWRHQIAQALSSPHVVSLRFGTCVTCAWGHPIK